MSVLHREPLPVPPKGFRFYHSKREVLRDSSLLPYQHLVLRAWQSMNLNAVLTLDGIPTVYVRDENRPLTSGQAAEIHQKFWNQGIATILLLRDPQKVFIYSAMASPVNPTTVTENEVDRFLVEEINYATLASWAERFYLRLATGQYYAGSNEPKFDPQQGVDAYLIDNLGAVRDELTKGKSGLAPAVAHAFLGRVLFTCYLCDRGIINLQDYFPKRSWTRLLDLLDANANGDPLPDLYRKLFRQLKKDFNGSMFDDDLDSEAALIQPEHLQAIRRFLNGDKVSERQRSLGFWAYDFKFIPAETISAIYEDFLEKEGGPEKRKSGAYHTPRFLAEMTLDVALEGIQPLRGRRYLDPAVGSGIFLVLLFNRLAAEWRASQRKKVSPAKQARDMLDMLASLCGVDKNLTACRIACFSLYLAFLDQFDPPALRDYMATTNERLPSLLRFAKSRKKAPVLPVIWERDFFELAPEWESQFDVVIGNPPWAGRGRKQIAHQFMDQVPNVLKDSGQACLLLPSKVFLNQTDSFQSQWLRRVTLDKVIQLADYRFILFKEALCPCSMARFTNRPPAIDAHDVEYVTPKVSLIDLRDGVIPVAPQDRKWIPLRLLLGAAKQTTSTILWKSFFWGTPRGLKFLDYLSTLPKLGDYVDVLSQTKGKRYKRWATGQGCKPWKKDSRTKPDRALKPFDKWLTNDPFVKPEFLEGMYVLPPSFCVPLEEHLKNKAYSTEWLYSKPPENL